MREPRFYLPLLFFLSSFSLSLGLFCSSQSLLLNVFSFYPVRLLFHWHYVILAKLEMCQSIFGEVCWSNCVRNCGHWWSTKSLQFFKNLKTFRFFVKCLIWVRWSTQLSLYFLLRYKKQIALCSHLLIFRFIVHRCERGLEHRRQVFCFFLTSHWVWFSFFSPSAVAVGWKFPRALCPSRQSL